MRTIAVFDFDGTITRKDTLLEFVKFASSPRTLYASLLLFAPMIVLMKCHLLSNSWVKERFLIFVFKGWQYSEFKARGEAFADVIDGWLRDDVISKLKAHRADNHTIYVISASIDEWVSPWCRRNGVSHVLCTQVEVDSKGRITGHFKTPNCYGQEKVNRLTAVEPDRNNYYLYAYGDSKGDKQMLLFADKGENVG